MIEQVRRLITDGHCVSPPRNPQTRKRPRDVGETNYTTTGRVPSWQRIPQDRQMWKQLSPIHGTLSLNNDEDGDGDDDSDYDDDDDD